MPLVEMNYLAVLAGAVVSVVIGSLWYSPALFGNAWMALIGKTRQEVQEDFSPAKIAWALFWGFVISYGLARVIMWTGKATWQGGLVVGILVSVVFAVSTIAVNHLFEGRPRGLTTMYAAHHLVEFALIGTMLGAWM
jgi:hypothetical protein